MAWNTKGEDLRLCPLLPLDPGLSIQALFPYCFTHSFEKYLLSSYSARQMLKIL